MRKDALNLNPLDAWQSAREHPLIGAGMTIGSYLPVAGGVIGAGDMLNNIYRGNYATAGLNAVQAAAGFMPGGGMVTRLAGKGMLGRAAAKAAPYITPLALDAKGVATAAPTMAHQIGSMVPTMVAQTADQVRQQSRPTYQKQMKEHEAMMNDFNQWRRHKQTLQNMAQNQAQEKEADGGAPPIAQLVGAPGYGEMAKKTWGVARGVAPYMAAASLGGHVLPHYYNDDVPGMMQGAMEGSGGAAGGIGGMVGGSLLGLGLGKALSRKFPSLDPHLTGYGTAAVGGTMGTLLGHRAGRKLVHDLTTENGEPRPFHFKSSAFDPELFNRLKQAAGFFNQPPQQPSLSSDPVGYVGHQVGRLGSAIGKGVEGIGQRFASVDQPADAQFFGRVGKTLGQYPKTVGGAAIAIPSLLALRYMMKKKEPSASSIVKKAAKKSQQHLKGTLAKSDSELIGLGVNPNNPKDALNALRRGQKKPKVEAPKPKSEMKPPVQPALPSPPPAPAAAPAMPTAPSMPVTPAPSLGDPSRKSFGPMPSMPTFGHTMGQMGHKLMSHPVVSFGMRHKIPLALGALATAGVGSYMMGRNKRDEEDAIAKKEMAKTGEEKPDKTLLGDIGNTAIDQIADVGSGLHSGVGHLASGIGSVGHGLVDIGSGVGSAGIKGLQFTGRHPWFSLGTSGLITAAILRRKGMI